MVLQYDHHVHGPINASLALGKGDSRRETKSDSASLNQEIKSLTGRLLPAIPGIFGSSFLVPPCQDAERLVTCAARLRTQGNRIRNSNMGTLRNVALIVLAISFATFVALFGRLPALK